jgi:putative FmdB family regulatory protein
MPTYDYVCDACGHEFELFQSIKAEPEKKCPECGKKKLRRLIGPGAALVFKGSGFYKTDYRSESYKKAAAAEKTARTPPAAKDKGSEGQSKAKESAKSRK